MLLVLSNGGYLAPPDEKPEQEKMWTETWKKVNRFLPQFFGELFPEEAGKPKKEREVPVREKVEQAGEKREVVENEKAEVEKGGEEADEDEDEDEDGEDEKVEKAE
jgi:brefeldin A-resistance guanine nucleotide exchange factor 1